MGQIAEYLKSAIKQISGNIYRTFMTMLGIIIGIAAVIAVIALGNGMTDYITNQFDSAFASAGNISINGKLSNEKITRDDIKEIKATLTDLNGVTPTVYSMLPGKVETKKGLFLADITGYSEGGLYSQNPEMTAGKYFTEQQVDNEARVCVMRDTDADKVFGTRDCLGMTVEINVGSKSMNYILIGLRTNNAALLDYLDGPDADYTAIIEVPYTSFGTDFGVDISKFDRISIYADKEILNKRTNQAKDIIGQNHGIRGTKAVTVYVDGDMGEIIGSTLGVARKFLMLVSAISLLVGGIGVMNIMLVSVTERTREIGIRKSIGARTEAIMVQFLAESALLTLMGGILGIIVGVIAAYFICTALSLRLIIEPHSILFAALFSIFIGVFFGIYPARKAAKMKPIDALRL
jgi:putative ABC transport system permease protein